jgi:long-chain acyl-CoA synthetase
MANVAKVVANGESAAFSDAAGIISRSALARWVAGLATDIAGLRATTVGLFAPNGVDWAAGFLAGVDAGRTVVPLPTFFSSAQLGHIVRDASVVLPLAAQETWPRAPGIPWNVLETARKLWVIRE